MPETIRRGHLILLHGIQSHSGWYEYSSQRFAEAGLTVSFLDRRGSGMNAAARGDAASAERLMRDVVQFHEHLRFELAADAELPWTLCGLSWGGKLAAATASRFARRFDGLALLYPGIHANVRASWWQNFQLNLADFADVRDKRIPIPVDDPVLFTGDPKWQEFIRNDEFALRDVTVGFLRANRVLDRIAQSVSSLDCSTLLMLAARDQIIDNRATCEHFQRLRCPRKTLFEYGNAQHTLEFEPDRDQFIDDLIRWLS